MGLEKRGGGERERARTHRTVVKEVPVMRSECTHFLVLVRRALAFVRPCAQFKHGAQTGSRRGEKGGRSRGQGPAAA